MFFKLRAGFLVTRSSGSSSGSSVGGWSWSCQQNVFVCWPSLSLPGLLSRSSWHTCRNPSGPIAFDLKPPGLNARKTCLNHALCRMNCPSPNELLLSFTHLDRFASPRIDCVLVCGCHKQPFEPAATPPKLGDSLCVPFPHFSTSALALTLAFLYILFSFPTSRVEKVLIY